MPTSCSFLHDGPPRALYGRQAHLWVHAASGAVLDVLAPGLDLPKGPAPLELRYAAHSPELFPGLTFHADILRYETAAKLARRALAAAGWARVTYTEERDPRLPWLRLDGVSRKAIPDVLALVCRLIRPSPHVLTCISTPEFGDVGTRPASFFRKGWIAPEPFLEKWKRNNTINALVARVAALEGSSAIRVIGSAAEGARFPGDLDLLLDTRRPDVPWVESSFDRLSSKLLALSRYGSPFYGLFDPMMVRPDGMLLSRDAMGKTWIPFPSRKTMASIMAQAKARSISLQELRVLETQAPAGMRLGPKLAAASTAPSQ